MAECSEQARRGGRPVMYMPAVVSERWVGSVGVAEHPGGQASEGVA